MCWKRKKVKSPVMQEKITRCVTCGKKLEDTSFDALKNHQAVTGHKLYRDVLVPVVPTI